MVECKSPKPTEVSTTAPVLIDTWWNVNWFIIKNLKEVKKVLIDTWWNVNINHSNAK